MSRFEVKVPPYGIFPLEASDLETARVLAADKADELKAPHGTLLLPDGSEETVRAEHMERPEPAQVRRPSEDERAEGLHKRLLAMGMRM